MLFSFPDLVEGYFVGIKLTFDFVQFSFKLVVFNFNLVDHGGGLLWV